MIVGLFAGSIALVGFDFDSVIEVTPDIGSAAMKTDPQAVVGRCAEMLLAGDRKLGWLTTFEIIPAGNHA